MNDFEKQISKDDNLRWLCELYKRGFTRGFKIGLGSALLGMILTGVGLVGWEIRNCKKSHQE